MFENVRQVPTVVRFREEARASAEAVRRVVLTAPHDARVALEAVASIETLVGPRQISREDGQRFITVQAQANVRGRDIGSFVEEAQGLVAGGIAPPPGYRVAWAASSSSSSKPTRASRWSFR